MKDIESSLDDAIKFFLSPLSMDNSDSKANGGFYGFQNVNRPIRETDKPFIFYEIAGYGIDLLLKLSNWYNDKKYIELATKAGKAILLAQIKSDNPNTNGAFVDRFYPDNGTFFETFHSYPNGVCVGALCELYHITKNVKFLESARAGARWLFEMLEKKGNTCIGFKEFFSENEKTDKVYPYESICIPFILLKHENDLELSEKQKKDLKDSISWALKCQKSEGYFPFFFLPSTNEFNNTTYSHFTIYPLYNLMGFPLSELEDMGNTDCFNSYLKCGNWLSRVQADNGGFYTYYHENGHVWHQQSPAIGQALCSFVHLYEKTHDKKFLECAKKSVDWLVSNQITDSKFIGAYYWIYPNKQISSWQKKIKYAKERIAGKLSKSDYISDVTVLLDKVPIWPVQFAIEGLYRFKNLDLS